MNGTTLTELGWNATEDHIPVPLAHKERERTDMVLEGNEKGQTVTLYGEWGEWLTSDTLMSVEN